MATNTLIFPFINPLAFYKETPDEDDRFVSREFTDWYFANTILDWQQDVEWCQPWQTSDIIHLQLQSTYGPVSLIMYRYSDDLVIDTIPFSEVLPNANDPDLKIFEVDVDLSTYDPGKYYFKITFGSPVALTLKSENIELSERIENSLLLEYSHPSFREDMIFETGIQPGIRVAGSITYDKTASKDTLFEDQPLNMEMLRSVNYRLWKLNLGGTFGIPDYMADKISRMLGCSTLLVDGKYYAKQEGASLDPNEIDEYPLRGWSISLREKLNRASRTYEDEIAANAQVAVMVNVDSKGFGADTGGNETVIQDVE